MQRTWIAVMLLCLSVIAQAMAPLAASWTFDRTTYLAAVAEQQLHLARLTANAPEEIAVLPAPNITTLATGIWRKEPTLLAARGAELLRFDMSQRAWVLLGTADAPIREILPTLDATPAALLLTGTPVDPVPADGAVWWATWGQQFSISRVTAVKDHFRPWQLWWTRAGAEQRFVAATYKATPFVPFEHNCMFLFTWKNHTAEACWLGSRLSRPYVDATHADLRGDGQWRMVAVEITRDGGHALSVYHPIGFGYSGDWRQEDAQPGLQRVACVGNIVICWGVSPENGQPVAWRLLPQNDEYVLQPLPEAPPALENLTRIDDKYLAGWWNGNWHVIPLQDK